MAEPATLPAPRLAAPRDGAEKAAILLLTLGVEAAARVFRHLSEPEVRQLSAAISRLRSIPREQAARVHEEAWRWLTSREGFLVDGERFARDLASGGKPGAALAREDPLGPGRPDGLATSLGDVAPAALAQLLAHEHPQVIAFVIAHLEPRHAAEVLGALPEALGADIIHRIADLQSVSDDMLGEVREILQVQVEGLGRVGKASELKGPKLAAEILNTADKELESRIFAQLDAEVPEVAENIRNLMFTFEDLIRLDNRGMQVVLKEVPREDLMLALKTASPAMRDKIFGNISQRAAEILKEDMGSMGPVRLKDVEKAQANIVGIVRRLEEEQKITLGGSGEDALV